MLLAAAPARAEEDPIDSFARWITAQGRWAGPTVPFPEPVARPANGVALDSDLLPLRLHVPAGVGAARAARALVAMEEAWLRLDETGWPLPFADGRLGGSSAFDLYLVERATVAASAETDGPIHWAPYDASTSWAAVDATLGGEALDACVLSALAQAALLGQDPAEHAFWRQATGAFVAYLASGRFTCGESVHDRQRAPDTGWSGPPDEAGAAAALVLAMVSEREDAGSGAFVREVWQLARQHSEGDLLRASPSLPEALARALDNAGESLEALLLEAAVARYFAGSEGRRLGAAYAALRALPADAEAPIVRDVALAELPEHVPLHPPLGDLGSAYVRVGVAGVPPGKSLPVWLRGSPGTRWSLTLVRLGSDGREIGRMRAPTRPVPSAFVPIMLEPGTESILVVATALPNDLGRLALDPDAEHHAKLILALPE